MRLTGMALAVAATARAAVGLTTVTANASAGTNVVLGYTEPQAAFADGTGNGAGACRSYLLGTWNTPDYYAAAKVVNLNPAGHDFHV